MAQRLPIPGKDNNKWGDILNGFLSVEHNPDGTLIKAGDIATAKAKAATAIQTINGKSATNGALTLAAGDVGAISQATADSKYISGVKQSTAPANPATDDLWYDSTNDQWKRWSGSAWVVTAGAIKSVDGQTGTVSLAKNYIPQAHLGLRRWYAALGKRTTEPADILWIGDSYLSGQGSSSWAQTIPAVALDTLRRNLPTPGVTGGVGYLGCVPAVYQGSPVGQFPDCPVTVNGVATAYQLALAGNGLDASTVILTKAGDYIEWTFSGDAFDVLLSVINTTGGTANLTVDGTPYTWNGASPLPNLIAFDVVMTQYAGATQNVWYGLRGLSVTSHKVRFTWASGAFVVGGLFAYNGDAAKGIRQVRACVSGQGTSSFYGGYATNWLSLNIGATYFPDLVVIDLGGDDHTGTTASHSTAASYKANLLGIISTIKTRIAARTDGGEVYVPSFVLMPMHAADPAVGSVVGGVTVTDSWAAYRQAMYDIATADANGAVEIFDLGQRLTPNGVTPYPLTETYQGLLYNADKTHYSDAGSDWAGNAIARELIPQ